MLYFMPKCLVVIMFVYLDLIIILMIMIIRLQQFYHATPSANQDQSVHQKRRLLLQSFHEQPDQFQLSELLQLVNDL
jgi:hypothetical protein